MFSLNAHFLLDCVLVAWQKIYRETVKVRQIEIVKVRSWGKTCTGCCGCQAKGQLSKLKAKGPSWRWKVRSEGVSQGVRGLTLVQRMKPPSVQKLSVQVSNPSALEGEAGRSFVASQQTLGYMGPCLSMHV